jgi:putative ubiquitin-RnfH superfamily antitoxin RatB of RatAB toxin-antitoxin module
MHIGVAYADTLKQVWLKLDVPDGCTVREAIGHSGLLEQFPMIDLETQPVGIFGKLTGLDARVTDGARIEIYRPIVADPEAAIDDEPES